VKSIVAGLLMGVLNMHANATPRSAVVNACLRTASESTDIRYTLIEAGAFEVMEDISSRKTVTILRHENDAVGIWQRGKAATFGLFFNGEEIPLMQVIRLDKENAPSSFNPYEAIWAIARDGKKSYICATFNFDGLGKSGSFQNVRGVYLIERSKHAKGPYYKVGNIAASEK
jgi:hypothetical protein